MLLSSGQKKKIVSYCLWSNMFLQMLDISFPFSFHNLGDISEICVLEAVFFRALTQIQQKVFVKNNLYFNFI